MPLLVKNDCSINVQKELHSVIFEVHNGPNMTCTMLYERLTFTLIGSTIIFLLPIQLGHVGCRNSYYIEPSFEQSRLATARVTMFA